MIYHQILDSMYDINYLIKKKNRKLEKERTPNSVNARCGVYDNKGNS